MTSNKDYTMSSIYLLNTTTQKVVNAELWDTITEKNLADWEAEWTPELFKLLKALNKKDIDRKLWPQSRHWNWQEKMRAIEGLLSNRSFAIICNGMTQALMITDLTKRAQIESQKNNHIVYIDFLEVAPWNRKALIEQQPHYAGAGSILILAAIEMSKEEGFKGRIGLHSLPQSNDFYANKVGMTDHGQDAAYQNLRYYEMTPEQAEAFIEKGRTR